MKIRMIPIECKSEIDGVDVLNERTTLVHMLNAQTAFLDEQGKIVDNRLWDWVGNSGEGRHCVRSGKLYGFVDDYGKLVAEPEWEGAEAFSNGLSIVQKDGLMGAVNANGELVIPAEWEYIYSFFEDTTMALRDGKTYYIDKNGRILSGDAWEKAGYFFESCAPVRKDGAWSFIDAYGNAITRFGWEDTDVFSKGLGPVKKGGKWGCINASGDLVIPCEWDQLGVFNHGLVRVCRNGLWGFVDGYNNIVLEPEWENGEDWDCVLDCDIPVIISKDNGNCRCWFDTRSRRIIDGEWWPMEDFQEDRAMVLSNETRKIGYINREGEYVSDPQWDEASQFENGFARVCCDEKYGLIDHEGKTVLEAEWDFISEKSCGCFVGEKGDAHFLIFEDGRILKTDPCRTIFGFYSGISLTLCVENGEFHYHYMGLDGKIIDRCINEKGEIVPMPDWTCAEMFFYGKADAWLGEQGYLLVLDGEDVEA